MEVVFSIAIMGLIVLAVVGTSILSIKNNSYAKNRTQANRYAQEAQEWVRNQKETTSWTIFSGQADYTYCMDTTPSWSDPSLCGTTETIANTQLFRNVTLTNNLNVITAEVVITWTDSQGVHEVINSTDYTNWIK